MQMIFFTPNLLSKLVGLLKVRMVQLRLLVKGEAAADHRQPTGQLRMICDKQLPGQGSLLATDHQVIEKMHNNNNGDISNI